MVKDMFWGMMGLTIQNDEHIFQGHSNHQHFNMGIVQFHHIFNIESLGVM